MKRLIKKIIGLSVIVPAIMLISCSNIGSGSENGGITPQETPVEKALKELSVSPEKVFKLTDKVTFPTTTSVSGVTITWTASPEGYIETAGTDIGKIKKRDTEDKSITLTATAVKDGETGTKIFTVIVCAENTEPSARDFADSLTIPSSVSSDMMLPKTVDGYTDAAITWESADENIIKIEDNGSDKKGVITKDIVDRKVKLFDVNVSHIEEISFETSDLICKYEFTGTEIIYTRVDKDKNKIRDGYKYGYSEVEPNLKKAVLTNIASYLNGKWITKQDVEALLNQSTAELNRLENKNPLTLGDFKTFLSLLPFLDEKAYDTDNKIFELLNWMCRGMLEEETAFSGLSETEKTAKLKSCIPALKKFVTIQNLWLKAQLFPALYEYTLTKQSDGTYKFSAKAIYDSSKNWYEQKGDYKYESGSGTIKRINLHGDNNKRYGTDNVPVQFTQGTPITLTGSEGSISVVITNITVSAGGTMAADISIDGCTAQSYTLKFKGNDLS